MVDDLMFYRHHAHHRTQIKLDVWHKSQSKAKSRKRRHLVASTSMALGEAIKKQGTEPCAPSRLLLRTCGAYASFSHGASLIRHPRCTKKICSAKTPTVRFYPHPLTTATVGLVDSNRTLPRLGPSLVNERNHYLVRAFSKTPRLVIIRLHDRRIFLPFGLV